MTSICPYDSCGKVSKWLSQLICAFSFTSCFICCCFLMLICIWWSRNNLMQKYRYQLLFITIASQISSLTAIIFLLDPEEYHNKTNIIANKNAFCKAQAISIEFIYLLQSIIPFIVLYKLNFNQTRPKSNQRYIHPKHISNTESTLTADFSDTEPINNHNNNIKCQCNKWIGIIWITICLTTCFTAVFFIGYEGNYYPQTTNPKIGWYGCYCKDRIRCYIIWGIPNVILEIYFVITALRAFSLTVYKSMVGQSLVIGYVVIRSIIIAWSLPMVLRNINDQRTADDFVGYMSLTMIFLSLLSVFTMVLPILYSVYNGYNIEYYPIIYSLSDSSNNISTSPYALSDTHEFGIINKEIETTPINHTIVNKKGTISIEDTNLDIIVENKHMTIPPSPIPISQQNSNKLSVSPRSPCSPNTSSTITYDLIHKTTPDYVDLIHKKSNSNINVSKKKK
eukprot:443833_1